MSSPFKQEPYSAQIKFSVQHSQPFSLKFVLILSPNKIFPNRRDASHGGSWMFAGRKLKMGSFSSFSIHQNALYNHVTTEARKNEALLLLWRKYSLLPKEWWIARWRRLRSLKMLSHCLCFCMKSFHLNILRVCFLSVQWIGHFCLLVVSYKSL